MNLSGPEPVSPVPGYPVQPWTQKHWTGLMDHLEATQVKQGFFYRVPDPQGGTGSCLTMIGI